ncbi:MAG: hypoxanthine phosphoribosyltransferase [Verrucomicrobiota bacterium]|jgi:hypoxanthine phosphoribosyltransferase
MHEHLEKILFDEFAIQSRLDDLARTITIDYRDKELTVVAILHGSLFFAADLVRRIPLPLKLECLRASSYHGGTQTTGVVQLDSQALPQIQGRHVLVLDDILDSGLTLHSVCRSLAETGGAQSLRTCVLLRKRKSRSVNMDADYVGFDMEDEFVVGYGLDFAEHYRNLPFIGALSDSARNGSVKAKNREHN